MHKRILLIVVLLLSASSCKTTMAKEAVGKMSVLADLPPVAHGLGIIDGHFVTNSIEALRANYKRGFRVFEVDLNMTSDGRLIARHDWTLEHYQWLRQPVPEKEGPIPFDEVKSLKIHGKYHTASIEQLLKFVKRHRDVYFVTDTKETDEKSVHQAFSYLVKAAKKKDPALLKHFIPQIYNETMLEYLKPYPFKNIIYTLYHLPEKEIPTPEHLAAWCVKNKVTTVTALPFRLTPEMQAALKQHHITIYTHTINDPAKAAAFKKKGIGIYTDTFIE